MLVVDVTIVHNVMEGMTLCGLIGYGGYVLKSTKPFKGVQNLPVSW